MFIYPESSTAIFRLYKAVYSIKVSQNLQVGFSEDLEFDYIIHHNACYVKSAANISHT